MDLSSDNALRFIELYNRIDDHLSACLDVEKADMSFTQKLNMVHARGDHIISKYYADLLLYAKLRNIIVHDTVSNIPIAQPSNDVISKIETIANVLLQPPLAKDSIAQPANKLLTAKLNTKLGELLKEMHFKAVQYVPILCNGCVCGVFSMSVLSSYAAISNSTSIPLNIELHDLDPYIRINNNKRKESFYFISENANAYEVDDTFDRGYQNHKQVGAVFITSTGDSDGLLIGMVTSADLAGKDVLH